MENGEFTDKVRDAQAMFSNTLNEIFQLFLQPGNKQAVEIALGKIKELYGAYRIQLVLFNDENASFSFLREVAPTDEEKMSSSLLSPFKSSNLYFQKDYPWLIGRIKKGKEVMVTDVDELPREALNIKTHMIENGFRSFLYTPVVCDAISIGFVGMDFKEKDAIWNDTDINNFSLLIKALSLYMAKEKVEKIAEKTSTHALQNDALFQAVFETLPVGIELYDEKGYLININPYELEILGATKEGILGVNLFDNPNLKEEQIERIARGEEIIIDNEYDFNATTETEYFITTHQGVTRLIAKCIPLRNPNEQIFGYLLLTNQDAGYYMEKEALRISLQKLRMAVNSQDSFFWEYDVKKDLVAIDYDLLDPRRHEQLRSIKKMEMTNKMSHLQYIHPEDVGRVLQKFNYMLDGELDFFTETYKFYNKEEYRWFTTSFRTYKYDERNKPDSIVCLTTDVTEQRKNEIELIKAKEANKIKTAFIENMSHEIRTPMNVIVGFSSILAENNNTEENQYLIDLIQRNNEILLRLIDSLLNFTQLESETMRYNIGVVDLKEVCADALKIKSANRKPEISFRIKEDLPSVIIQTDRDRLLQVLYQFLDNANKYTEKGEVTISYKLLDTQEVRMEITDTGKGMTEEELAKIFSHFYKTDPFQIGVGLGLSIVKKIIEDLGGTIGVESASGEGSTFWFTLPLYSLKTGLEFDN